MCKTLCGNPNCGADLTQLADPPRSPCPHCGATVRRVDRAAQDALSFKSQLKTRLKRQGKSKPKIESITGDDLHRDTGKWHHKERVIDQEKDYYRETVTDPETGKVVHHQEQKLSEHRGHGTAKKKA